MVFREDLEAGTLSKTAIDSEVAEYRAKLIAEAETEAASAAATAAAEKKSAIARYAGQKSASGVKSLIHHMGRILNNRRCTFIFVMRQSGHLWMRPV